MWLYDAIKAVNGCLQDRHHSWGQRSAVVRRLVPLMLVDSSELMGRLRDGYFSRRGSLGTL